MRTTLALLFGLVTAGPVHADDAGPMEAALDAVLERHVAAIQNRDLAAYAATLTTGNELYLVMPDGAVYKTREAVLDMHREWFTDPDWTWKGETVRKVIGMDLATVLMTFDYRDHADSEPRSFWLVLIFALEDGEWRLVQDQVTRIQ